MAKVRILMLLITTLIIGSVGTLVILYAKGYRFSVGEKVEFGPKGILVLNSDPTGAQVFINGELKTATNATINLDPKEYDVTIKKDGFLPWQKHVTINTESVTQLDTLLVQVAPSLTALTFSGVLNPQPSSDFSKMAYGVPPSIDTNGKAGLWILETVNLPLGFNRDPRQITDGDITGATWEWSPDSREILLTTKTGIYLLNTNELTPQGSRLNVSNRISQIRADWKTKLDKRLDAQIARLPDELETIFTAKAVDIQFSPDETRILYTASGSATIEEGLIKPFPGSSTQKQERSITDGNSYVYDIKEDRNFLVGSKGQTLSWIANSLNLMIAESDKIVVLDYDGANKQTVFAGGYTFPHAYPSTSSNRLLILTSLGGKDSLPNLYWLSLK